MKNIVIWGLSNYNWLWVPLARELKRNHGAKMHFICSTPQDVEHWKKQDNEGVIDTFVSISHFFFEYDNCTDTFQEISKRARYYEEKYNTLVVDVLQSDRHLGRGFSAGGPGHPKSALSEKATYLKSLNIFNKVIRFWEDYFDKTNPDLLIGVVSGITGKSCSAVARSRGIPIRVLNFSKYQSYFHWAIDEYYSFPDVEKNFRMIDNYKELVDPKEIVALKRLPWTAKNYQKYKQYGLIRMLPKRILSLIKRHAHRKYKGIVTMGNYKLSEQIKHLFRLFRTMRNLDKMNFTDVKELENKSYIFYPLHIEPETALSLLNPEFNEQLALIELLAKNLSAGTLLVVKDHIGGITRRPRDFYSTLFEIPNVVVVSPEAYALEIAKKAKCVVVITSTLGAEAAILGIPVISVGIRNSFNFLPYVYVVESWKELRPLLSRLCCDEEPEEVQKQRKEDGMRYLAALKASSFDLSWSNYTSKNREPATEKEIEVLYPALMKSLAGESCFRVLAT